MKKDICRQCCDSHCSHMKWSSTDDANWFEGKVYCCHEGSRMVLLSSGPPYYCYYLLEHVVMTDENVGKTSQVYDDMSVE